MDFEPRYTTEQQEFRSEVKDWLAEALPDGLEFPADSNDLSYNGYLKLRQLGRSLGEKGWLWPTAPTEYGGGGLSIDHAIVIEEELDEAGPVSAALLRQRRTARRRECPRMGQRRPERPLPASHLQGRGPHLAATHRAGRWLRSRRSGDERGPRTATTTCSTGRRYTSAARTARKWFGP